MTRIQTTMMTTNYSSHKMEEFLLMFGGIGVGFVLCGRLSFWLWLRKTERKLTAKHGDEIWRLNELAPEAFNNGKDKEKNKQEKTGPG